MNALTVTTFAAYVAFGAAALLLSTSGCKKKTPAERLGDKVEEVGDKIEDKADEAD